MKRLGPTLAVGMLLISFTTATVPPYDEVMKLCGRDFVDKLINLCASMKTRVDHPYDSFQLPDDSDSFVKASAKNYRRTTEPPAAEPLDSSDAEQTLYIDYSQYMQLPTDIAQYWFEMVDDPNRQSGSSRQVIQPKLRAKQLESTCCEDGCTNVDILQRCAP